MNPRTLVRLSLGIYGAMIALGLGWSVFRGRPNLTAHPEPWWSLEPLQAHGASVGLGLLLAGAVVGFTRWAGPRFEWARALHEGFRSLVGTLDGRTVLILALSSSLGEEVFFRGALQPSIGWIATSVVFGLVHLPQDRRFLAWTPWALIVGFALGAIHEASGSLLGAWLAHFLINALNLRYITKVATPER